MSKIKSFLNRHRPTAPPPSPEKIQFHLSVEKKLIPRLRGMGMVLLSFGLTALCYALFSPAYEVSIPETQSFVPKSEMEMLSGISLNDDPTSPPFELTPTERLNFYFVAFVFSAVGTTCLVISKKRKKQHADPT